MRAALIALLLCAGCTPSVLDEARASAVRPLVEGIVEERVMGHVHALVDQHRDETPLDCEALLDLDHIDQHRRPACHLTRNQARDYVRAQLQSFGLSVRTFDTADDRFPTSTVVGDLKGTTAPDEIVLVAAHFDAFYAGADDNSSGVAAMLELAQVLSSHSFERTIRFVGLDLEEFGLVGSTRYVHGLGEERIVAALVFDCIGYKDDAPGSQRAFPGLPVPDRGDFIAIIGNSDSAREATQMTALSSTFDIVRTETVLAGGDGAAPMTGNLMRSDHAPFWLTGRTAVFLTDTANFRNPNYHKDTDTPDTLDPQFLASVTRLAAASLGYFAGVTK